MPIDPRMMSQAAMLRGQNPYMPGANPAAIGTPIPGGGRPVPGPPIPPGPGAAPPQSVAPGGAGPGINSGIPQQLTPEAAGLVAGMPQAQERFSQGERQGAMADELRASSLEPVKGRMVGRIYVPASIAEGGAKLIQAYVARQKEQEQKEERRVASEEMSMLKSGFLESLKGGAGSDEDEV